MTLPSTVSSEISARCMALAGQRTAAQHCRGITRIQSAVASITLCSMPLHRPAQTVKAAVDARVCRPAVVLNMRERYTLALSMRELRRGVPRLFAGADRKR
jgi:hypothetical protein